MRRHSTTIDPDKAKALCTKQEYALVRESRAGGLQGSARKSLATRLRRARALRDKYRDLHRRQRGGARGKAAGGWLQPLHDAARTLAKAELFAEVVERFERAIAAVDDRERQAREKEARSADARALTAAELRRRKLEAQRRARARHVVPPPAAFGSVPGRPAPRPLRPIRTAVGKARSGHSRASFRRQQARRDGRR